MTVCNLDTVTHVIINGKEYERFVIKDGGNPNGKAILLGVPCVEQSQAPSQKQIAKGNNKPFKFWARIGSNFGGKPIANNCLRLDFYPLQSGVTKSNESEFNG